MSLRVATVEPTTSEDAWDETENDSPDAVASLGRALTTQLDKGGGGLPPPRVSEPDADGIVTIVDYYVNDEGYVVQRTRRVRRRLERRRVCAAVAERRRCWRKFGVAATENANTTTQANEDIPIEWNTRDTEVSDDEESGEAVPSLGAAPSSASGGGGGGSGSGEDLMTNKSIVVCRICGRVGDHWTLRCPYKGLQGAADGLGLPGSAASTAPDGILGATGAVGAPSAGSGGSMAASATSSGATRYVPPSMRSGASARLREGDSLYGRREENSIRISNLTEGATEDDLRQLLEPFGRVVRIYLARDKYTGAPKGFAFAAFAERSAAERCIAKLNGFGYDHLILSVEWARPSGDRANAASSVNPGA
jgi:translation initiation factor 3 subunit G